jgi:hypothetical protein
MSESSPLHEVPTIALPAVLVCHESATEQVVLEGVTTRSEDYQHLQPGSRGVVRELQPPHREIVVQVIDLTPVGDFIKVRLRCQPADVALLRSFNDHV